MPAVPTVPTNGAAIKALRLRSGLSQRELSATSGVAQSHISNIENGEHPSELAAHRIATALSVPLSAIRCAQNQTEKDTA